MPAALEPLLDVLADPHRQQPARAVLLSLGATCVPQLLAAAAGTVPARRAAAASILLEIAKDSVPILVRLLGVEATRDDALAQLGRVDGEQLPLLIESLADSPDPVRRHARPAMARFAPAFVASATSLVEGLLAASTRERSLVCLAIAGEAVVPVLVRGRAHGVTEDVIARALWVIGPAAVPALAAERDGGDAELAAFVDRVVAAINGR
jgi:hypothetical protein